MRTPTSLRLLALAGLLLLPSACRTTAGGGGRYESTDPYGLAVVGRYVVFDDYEGEASTGGTSVDGDVDVEGFGADLLFLRSNPGFALGWRDREYEDDVDSTEFQAGLRFALGETDVRPYLTANVRYGLGLEFPGGTDSDEFWGWSAGAGVLAFLTDNLFVDVSLEWEDVFGDIEVGAADVQLEGLIGTVGIGFAF